MRTEESIFRLFGMVDDQLAPVNKRSNANWSPSDKKILVHSAQPPPGQVTH